MVDGLILVRAAEWRRPAVTAADPWIDFSPLPASRPLGAPVDTAIAADWKLIIEQWLESAEMDGSLPANPGWSARSYRHLLGPAAHPGWQRRFIAPNHLIEFRPDGFTLLQVLPSGPGQSLLRRHDFTLCEDERIARAARYVAARLSAPVRPIEHRRRGVDPERHRYLRSPRRRRYTAYTRDGGVPQTPCQDHPDDGARSAAERPLMKFIILRSFV